MPDERKGLTKRIIVPCPQLLFEREVCDRLGLTRAQLRAWEKKGALTPARVERLVLYTLADVRDFETGERERCIMSMLNAGRHPCDICFEQGYRPEEVARTLDTWGKLSGYWIVEGPPGSYARWLERFGLVRFTPKLLRRLIELLLTDAYVQKKVSSWDLGQWLAREVPEKPRRGRPPKRSAED